MALVKSEAAVMWKLSLLLWAVHLLLIHTVDSSKIHYIIPSQTTQCPGESCLTLATLAANSSGYFDQNTTMIFLEGNHTIDSELIVSKMNGSLTLTNNSGRTVIVCSDGASLNFSDIIHLQIIEINFIWCHVKVDVSEFILVDSMFYGGLNSSALHLYHSNASIIGSSFVFNTAGTYQTHVGILELYSSNIRTPFSQLHPSIQSTSARVGGALVITSSTVNISSTYFVNNSAKMGGAIYSQMESNINIINCTFVNNSATGCGDDGCHGGALFIDRGCTVTAHNSTFINNSARYGGGAIATFQGTFLDSAHNLFSSNRVGKCGGVISTYSHGKIGINKSFYTNNTGTNGGAICTLSYGNVTVNNSSFENNKGVDSGGVFHAQDRSSVTVSNSIFIYSEAGNSGGVIAAHSNSRVKVGNSYFNENKAGSDGGAIYAYSNSSITIDNSSFNHNVAEDDGGAIHVEVSSSVIVGSSSFQSNTAVYDVGGVAAASNASSITISDSFFNNNEAGNSGGVLHAQDSSSITMNNSIFIGNEAVSFHGGVMVAHSNSNIRVGNCTFNKNKAGYDGGAIFAYSNSSVIMENSCFDHNTAEDDGGAIHAWVSSSIVIGSSSFHNNTAVHDVGGVAAALTTSSITMNDSHFENNEAGNSGGVLHAQYSSSITVRNSVFVSNEALKYGGVMVTHSNSSVEVDNSSFYSNKAGNDGGALYAYSNSSIAVGNSFFDDNEAVNSGGVLSSSEGSSININYSFFQNNTAGDVGGVAAAFSTGAITVSNSFLENNEAGNSGGVLQTQDKSSITVISSSFVSNKAGNNGGVIVANSSCNVKVSNSSFDENKARYHGGVIFADFNSSITIDNSSFNHNVADDDGGAIRAVVNTSVIICSSYFQNNRALDVGGVAAALSTSSITISDSFFDNNEAGSSGGVLHAQYSSSITMNNSIFISNEAISSHGGVMVVHSNSNVRVGNCTFNENKAGYDGGAIYAYSNSSVIMENSSFNHNTAEDDGGTIHAWVSSSIVIRSSSFHSNTAVHDVGGVAVALTTSSITIDDGLFEKNEAGDSGGVLHAEHSSSITVRSSIFVSNKAFKYGGVMVTINSYVEVDNSSFDSNKAGNGGVMYAYFYGSIAMDSNFFSDNEATDSGGVLYANDRSVIIVVNSSFDKSEARYHGGVMYANDRSTILVDNSSFASSVALEDGGVISAFLISNIIVNNSFFINNQASNEGGVASVWSSSTITAEKSSFEDNRAGNSGGVIAAGSSFNITIVQCSFNNNTAVREGGVIQGYSVITDIEIASVFTYNCTFFDNSASEGGVVYFDSINFMDIGSIYRGNEARNGGVFTLNDGVIRALTSRFVNNTAIESGGVLYTPSYDYEHVFNVENCMFVNNSARSGGAIAVLYNASVTVTASTFIQNNAIRGGAIYLLINCHLLASYSNFSHNSAKRDGGMIFSENRNLLRFESCKLNFNRADNNGGAICLLFQGELHIEENDNYFIGNQARHSGGAVYISESTMNISCRNLLIVENSAKKAGGAIYASGASINVLSDNSTLIINNQARSGGALYVSRSKFEVYNASLSMSNNTALDTGGAIHLNEGQFIFSDSHCILTKNEAVDGGALYARESKLIVDIDSQLEIYACSALHHGGGMYLTKTELKVKGEGSIFSRNRANSYGGGIYASSSTISADGVIDITDNDAKNGGGISLEKNAKLNGSSSGNSRINFISNRASCYGGAMYVNDETNPDVCATILELTNSSSECFSKSVFVNVSDNSADVSGSNLFGGFLDSCIVHSGFSNEYQSTVSGITNFLNSSNINETQLDTITSLPVRLCFCKNGQPDCNYQPESMRASRGKTFSIQFTAYDQVHHPVNASVQCFLNSSAGGLGERQQIQNINQRGCTSMNYDLYTPNNFEELTFSIVRAPCNDISGISKRSIMIEITCSCPIGFQTVSNNNGTSCDCACDHVFQPYKKTECNAKTESIIRRDMFWISYVNWSNSSGYVIFPHCPFDYCHAPDKSVSFNLNLPDGSDTQCDHNRMGTLCGTCKPGLSVSLGSSTCLPCPTHWPVFLVIIIIIFTISGIGLVALLLGLNLTVSIGTLNAIIFYANIVAANKSAFFTSGVSFASVFISFLNFDIGFDVCFFNGMDTYIKTWLQLAFPAYIIILVIAVIQLSYYFDTFGRLIGKKDPVATLATLILLSYTKLLQTIIKAFSSATLTYPDGSKSTLWLPDATVEYFTSKHAVLFFVAILILILGFTYTLFLFSWQWFLRLPRKKVKWLQNQKCISFMEIYHVPYTPSHRYWTGLLLLIRVILYLVSALNPSGDTRVTLSATIFIMTSLFLYIATFSIRMYKNRFINTMEMLTYFNIIALSIFTWYVIDADTNQTIVINLSITITFIQLALVVVYHIYKYMNHRVFTLIQESAVGIKIRNLTSKKQKRHDNSNEDIHQSYEILDLIDRPPASTTVSQMQPGSAEPTMSVIELSIPQLAPATPPPLEAKGETLKLQSTEQQVSEQDGRGMITVTEENISTAKEIEGYKQLISDYSEAEVAACNENEKRFKTEMENSGTLEENSILQCNSNAQISYCPPKEIKSANEGPSTLYTSSGPLGTGSQCINIEADVHSE